jgi:hypothetical protein
MGDILRDGRQSDTSVGDLVDLAGGTHGALHTDAVDGLGDLGVGEGDCVNGVVGAAANGADREAVAT